MLSTGEKGVKRRGETGERSLEAQTQNRQSVAALEKRFSCIPNTTRGRTAYIAVPPMRRQRYGPKYRPPLTSMVAPDT